jgi:hypothetical protein
MLTPVKQTLMQAKLEAPAKADADAQANEADAKAKLAADEKSQSRR